MEAKSKEKVKSSERLKSLRISKNMKCRELAEAAGVSSAYVSRLESGSYPIIPNKVAERLASALGVSKKFLLDGFDEDQVLLAEADYIKAIEQSGLRDVASEKLHEIALWMDRMIRSDRRSREAASMAIQSLVDEFSKECEARNSAIRDAGLKMARARTDGAKEENIFDISSDAVISMGVEKWNEVRKRISECLSAGYASQADIVRATGLSRQLIHQYIKGGAVPTFDKGAQLLEWVQGVESSKQSGSDGASTPSKPRTQTKSKDQNENSPGPS